MVDQELLNYPFCNPKEWVSMYETAAKALIISKVQIVRDGLVHTVDYELSSKHYNILDRVLMCFALYDDPFREVYKRVNNELKPYEGNLEDIRGRIVEAKIRAIEYGKRALLINDKSYFDKVVRDIFEIMSDYSVVELLLLEDRCSLIRLAREFNPPDGLQLFGELVQDEEFRAWVGGLNMVFDIIIFTQIQIETNLFGNLHSQFPNFIKYGEGVPKEKISTLKSIMIDGLDRETELYRQRLEDKMELLDKKAFISVSVKKRSIIRKNGYSRQVCCDS